MIFSTVFFVYCAWAAAVQFYGILFGVDQPFSQVHQHQSATTNTPAVWRSEDRASPHADTPREQKRCMLRK